MKTLQPFPNTSWPAEGSALKGPHLQASRDAFSLKRINCFFCWASSGSWKPRRADPVCSRSPLLLAVLFQLRRPTRLRRRNKPKISASKGQNLALLTHLAPAAHISGQQVNYGFYTALQPLLRGPYQMLPCPIYREMCWRVRMDPLPQTVSTTPESALGSWHQGQRKMHHKCT